MIQATTTSPLTAAYLTPEEFRVAASLLFGAYQDDPIFLQALASEDRLTYEKRLRLAIREELAELWVQKQPLIGLFQDNKLIAIAGLAQGDFRLGDQRFWNWRLKMMLVAGWQSTQALINKEQRLFESLPPGDCVMLQFIAVAKQHQGAGVGKHLLRVIEQWRVEQSQSLQLTVYTTTDTQRKLFNDSGYRFHKKVQIGNVEGELLVCDKLGE
ncbi:GNAT family N-acetyltransferase [Paraferrimonas haliotis]|uniref:GNAT family N-acetyltransferase n=1 Tax=Paraferrimonas haliotis TaxID=2013866 RepID=UPI0015CC0B4C|nr:GNAT family N-acetyltransferase [Paraferrimonas haliotis]